jgi:hypothetical protein
MLYAWSVAVFHLPAYAAGPALLWVRAVYPVIAAISGLGWIWIWTEDWRQKEHGWRSLINFVSPGFGLLAVLGSPILALSWYVHPCDIEGTWTGFQVESAAEAASGLASAELTTTFVERNHLPPDPALEKILSLPVERLGVEPRGVFTSIAIGAHDQKTEIEGVWGPGPGFHTVRLVYLMGAKGTFDFKHRGHFLRMENNSGSPGPSIYLMREKF